ncbi:hypothetical protein [Streptomyces anulatus]|uniref:hypothetical protein n=1 Tax=Streptomyces anulatus TaxID=1892 RepID=UPI001D185D95|nr:hypothetical protein [Streptomyces anulatus]
MPTSPTPADRPAEGPLGPITPIRCNMLGCHWACHGVPDKYGDSRARIVREHMAAEHAPTPESADRPADQLRDCLTAAVVETMQPRYGGPQHNTPGGLSLTATAEEIRLHRARPIVEAVLAAMPAPALAVARQLLGTTETAAPSVDEQEPVQLRWGLDDVMYGDDDTTTVLLSGPGREPYWVELDPERTGALRDALAGPAAPPAPADRAAVLREDPTPVSLATTLSELADEQTQLAVADDLGRRRDMAAARRRFVTDLRRLADDAAAGVQPPTTCTCDFIDEPWIRMQHAATCPAAPAAPEETQ